MDDITIRRIEAIIGIYSHPDIPKFILNVLTNFETPVSSQFLKKNTKSNNSHQLQNNKSNLQQIPNVNQFQQNINQFQPNINQFPVNNQFQISNANQFQTNNGNQFQTNNGNQFQTNNGNQFSNLFQQNTHLNTNTQANNFSQLNTQVNNNLQFNSNQLDNNSFQFNNTNNNETIFAVNKEVIDKKPNIKLKCSMAFYNDKELNISNKMFISKKNGDSEVILPANYVWEENEKIVLDNYLTNIINLRYIASQNDENNKTIFLNIHTFLQCFEKLLKEVMIPCINNDKLSKLVNENILNSITLPVLIAFENEFLNSHYSIMLYLIKNDSIKENLIKFLDNLNFDKVNILEVIDQKELIIDNLLFNIFKNVHLIKYFQINS